MTEQEREKPDAIDRVMQRSKLLDQVSGTLLGQSPGGAADPAARANEAVRRLRGLDAPLESAV